MILTIWLYSFLSIASLLTITIICQVESSASSSSSSKDVVSKWEVFKSLFGMQYKNNIGQEQQHSEPQKLMVIGANLGRTGTQSFVEALRRLGLKCYHFKDGVYETQGHFDIWDDVIDNYPQNATTFNILVDKLAEDGFNATSDFPAFVFYKEFFDLYPDAKVVVTIRPNDKEGIGFASSFVDAIVPLYKFANDIPFRYLKIFQIFSKMFVWSLTHYGVPLDPITKLPDPKDLAAAQDIWIERVKSTIPTDKLLIFSYKDGWEPLCDFLAPIDMSIQEKCDTILKAGESYPYLNNASAMKAVHAFMRGITVVSKGFPFIFAICVGCILLARPNRRKRRVDKIE